MVARQSLAQYRHLMSEFWNTWRYAMGDCFQGTVFRLHLWYFCLSVVDHVNVCSSMISGQLNICRFTLFSLEFDIRIVSWAKKTPSSIVTISTFKNVCCFQLVQISKTSSNRICSILSIDPSMSGLKHSAPAGVMSITSSPELISYPIINWYGYTGHYSHHGQDKIERGVLERAFALRYPLVFGGSVWSEKCPPQKIKKTIPCVVLHNWRLKRVQYWH